MWIACRLLCISCLNFHSDDTHSLQTTSCRQLLVMPNYRQHITCPTRDSNILYHCYTIIKTAYHSVPLAALGLSDHCLVHLIPTYRQKLKSAKPVVKTVKRWTNETERALQACHDLNLDELTETVTSYISFCEDMCIPTRTNLTYNNDKPWFTAKLGQLRQAKKMFTGRRVKSCINTPNTHWKSRSE